MTFRSAFRPWAARCRKVPLSATTSTLCSLTAKAGSSWVLVQLHDFFSYLVGHFAPGNRNDSEYELPHGVSSSLGARQGEVGGETWTWWPRNEPGG